MLGGMNDHTLPGPWPYPRWIAHRGAGKLAPENTLAAFKLGHQHGFRMFECDAKLSADGQLYLLHDDTLERTTSGRGAAAAWAWSDLAELDAGAWHSEAFQGERLLTLDALAHWLQAQGDLVNLEIKPCPGREAETGAAVARAAQALWVGATVQPLLSSFSVEALQAAQQAAPAMPRALLFEFLPPDWLDHAKALGVIAVVPHHALLTAEVIAQAHVAGLRVLTYTVNEPERAQTLWSQGLDGLITDKVDLFEAQARAERP
jgi:glycerophosphoryl diester phosphodiesterase